MPILSIIIPVYNEEKTLPVLLDALIAVEIIGQPFKEIIIVDDASTDNTAAVAAAYTNAQFDSCAVVYQKHTKNEGKGAALQTGIKASTGAIILVQDADMEYNPSDINTLIKP